MISAGEFRNGVTFEQDGQVLQVVEFQHVKPGKGAAFVRTKTKNVITGSVVETSYNPTAKFPQAFIERREVTYSYEDGDLYYFMDNETYEQIPVAAADVPENFKFCKENEICKLLSYKGKVFSVEIPNFIELEVTETEPAFKVKTVDSTGAGDVFHGAYIYAWLQGWDAKTCCRFCSGVSAIKCTRPGGRSGIPTLPVLEKFLATGEIDGAELDERVRHYKYGLLNA